MDEQKIYLSILMEEYKSLREESKQASINMFSALRWGSAIVGALMGAGFVAWNNRQHFVVLIIFYIVVPILSSMSMFLWLGEAIRFKRVGDYICMLEQKIGYFVDKFEIISDLKSNWEILQKNIELNMKMSGSQLNLIDPLTWEQWLRATRKGIFNLEGHQELIYVLRLSFFPITMIFSFLIATYYVIAYPRFTPEYLLFLQDYIPGTKVGTIYFIIFFVLIFIFSISIATLIGLKLRAKSKVTLRSEILKTEENNNK